jgi:hypothetical protein
MSDIFHKAPSFDEPLPSLRPHRGYLVFFLGTLPLALWTLIARFPENLPRAIGICVAGIGLIFAILAWIIGAHDLREMKNQRMDPAGKNMTRFGMAWGSIIIIFTICVAAAMVGAMLFIPPGKQ